MAFGKSPPDSILRVNSGWLFSLYWCVGVDSAQVTDYCHILTKQESTIWHLVSHHLTAYLV